MTDSEEVEKVLQSLAGESGDFETTDGDPDRDKVEELLRQLEQEKEQTPEADSVDDVDKPKLPTRLATKKPNGLKVGDKPAAPKKSPPREEAPKPWKKKGAFRKRPAEDEDLFVVATKAPTLRETDQEESTTSPTNNDEAPTLPTEPSPPPHSSDTELPDAPNNTHEHVTHTLPSPDAPLSPVASHQPPLQNGHAVDTHSSASPAHTSSPTPYSSSMPHSASPSPHSTPPTSRVSSTPKSTPPPSSSTTFPTTPVSSTPVSSTPPLSRRTPQSTTTKDIPPHSNFSDNPTKHKSADDILIDDSIKNDERVFSKQDFETLRNQILQQFSEETAILAMEFQELKQKYDEEVRGKAKLKSVLVEYEKTIAKLIDEAGMSGHHEGLAERVVELENETKRKTEEYEAIALAHSELKSRYDVAKTDNEKLKSNEQVQKEIISKLQNELQGSETRFNVLKTHAETKLDTASEQLVKMRDERAKEMAQLQARAQQAEARRAAVEKENKELLDICDGLMKQLEEKKAAD